MMLKKPGMIPTLLIPDHREVKKNTLAREIREAGLTVAEFVELLNR